MDDFRERVDELLQRAGLGSVTPNAAIALAMLLLVIVGFAAWRWARPGGGGGELSVPASSSPSARATATGGSDLPAKGGVGGDQTTGTPGPAASAPVFVDMAGEVECPGVYELPAGSRVQAGVDAAGGMTKDAVSAAVNLARVLADGEQVIVPSEKTAAAAGHAAAVGGPAAGGAGAGTPAASGLVNINTASAEALDELPGVGPSTATKIIADRAASGPFKSVDDLGRVSGIGPKKLEQLKPLVCVR